MPLVRFQVRNEYGLGDQEVYRKAKKDDSAAILQGVSVAGLAGILRQLGDLAEFAADVFHDLHDQARATAARCHKIMIRVHHLEASLPPLEKHVLTQTAHIHFAYTAGSDWRADIRCDQNHLTRSELPRFILDSYEECRAPPCLYLLDKFDTAGIGACLKRYSDPSFFKMHCASSEQTKADKAQREKKAYKSKRKVRRQRNGEAPGKGSRTWHNSRSQYASRDADGRTDSLEIIHKPDERSKSKQSQGSPPFDLITRTDYIEHVFDVDSSMKPENEPNLLSTYLKKQHSDTGPSVPPDNQNATSRENYLPHHPLHGQSSLESSVSWEEKAEIIEPAVEPGNILEECGQASDSLPLSFDSAMLQLEPSGLGKIDQSCSSDARSDGVVSEPDNYIDALNTMESEIESDSKHWSKQAVETPVASYGSLNKEMSQKFSDSDSLDGSTHAQSPQISAIESFAETGFIGSHDLVELLEESDFRSTKPISVINTAKSEESPPAETTGIASIKLWTNGGILGVEPSKPPAFSTEMGTSVPRLEHTESSISCQDMGQDDRSVNLHSQESVLAISETKLEKFKISQPANTLLNETLGVDSTKANVEKSTSGSVENNFEASELSLMANHDSMRLERSHSFEHRKHSVGLGTPVAYEPTPKEKLELGSPRASVYYKSRYIEHPSPPLEHMKILFDPMNNLEASKLKLEFSNGDHLHGSIEDALLPSFHLLPKPLIPLQDIGSETDDDTFYRPSSTLSKDLLSQDYESDSEQWETRSNDEMYNGLYRVSSATSISSSLELDGKAHPTTQPYHEFGNSSIGEDLIAAVTSQGFMSFGIANSLRKHQNEGGELEPKELLGSQLLESNGIPPPQPPPPLHPLQWRIMNPPVTSMEDKHNIILNSLNQQSDAQVPGAVDTEQSKLATPGKLQKKAIAVYENITPKLLKEPNQSAIVKRPDEREVLLEQIRAKSFSLRSAVTARPNLMPAPTTNINVAAILEKANAIRQVVAGSDEGGDDDKWSDC